LGQTRPGLLALAAARRHAAARAFGPERDLWSAPVGSGRTVDSRLRAAAPTAACAALALAVTGLLSVLASGSACRFVGGATQDYSGTVEQPGRTAGLLAFTVAPLVAGALLVLSVRWRHHGSPLPRWGVAVAVSVLPVAAVTFVLWAAKAASACGLPLAMLGRTALGDLLGGCIDSC
jgi:hypothetical protein